jgi:hypothetical protein
MTKKILVLCMSMALANLGIALADQGKPEDKPKAERPQNPEKPQKPEKVEKVEKVG